MTERDTINKNAPACESTTLTPYLTLMQVLSIILLIVFPAIDAARCLTNSECLQGFAGDIDLAIRFATEVFAQNEYLVFSDQVAVPFVYPLPWALLLYYLGLIAQYRLFFCVFLTGMYTVLPVLTFYIMTRCVAFCRNRYFWVIALCTYISLFHYYQWDIRAANINLGLVFLATLSIGFLLRGSSGNAGFLAACTAACKIYPVFLLVVFAFKRDRKAILYFLAGSVLFFALIPILFLGTPTWFHLTWSWVQSVMSISKAEGAVLLNCYLCSFSNAVVTALGGSREAGLASFSPATWEAINLALKVFKIAWIAFALLCLWRSCGIRDESKRVWAQFAIVLLLPIPISPLLQPHHFVLAMPAVFYVIHHAFDDTVAPRIRVLFALLAVAIFVVATIVRLPQAYQGFSMFLFSLLLIICCATPRLSRNDPTQE